MPASGAARRLVGATCVMASNTIPVNRTPCRGPHTCHLVWTGRGTALFDMNCGGVEEVCWRTCVERGTLVNDGAAGVLYQAELNYAPTLPRWLARDGQTADSRGTVMSLDHRIRLCFVLSSWKTLCKFICKTTQSSQGCAKASTERRITNTDSTPTPKSSWTPQGAVEAY